MIDVTKSKEPISAGDLHGEDLEYADAFTDRQMISQCKFGQWMLDASIGLDESVWPVRQNRRRKGNANLHSTLVF